MENSAFNHFRDLLRRDDLKRAVELAERQLLVKGESDRFWLTQISVAQKKAGHPKQALDAAERALRHSPSDNYALLARAEALYALERYEDALNGFKDAEPDTKTRARARFGVLNCLMKLKEWDKLLHTLTRWEMRGEASHHWRIKALSGKGNLKEAISECGKWLSNVPDNPRALWDLVELEIRQDGINKVAGRYARLAKIPSLPPVYSEIFASLCRRMGKTAAAAAQYDKLLSKSSDPRLYRKQAFVLAKSGKEQEAVPMFEELLRKSPGDMYIHSAYVAAARRIGKLEKVRNFYQELLTLHPDEKSIYGRLGRVNKELEKTKIA